MMWLEGIFNLNCVLIKFVIPNMSQKSLKLTFKPSFLEQNLRLKLCSCIVLSKSWCEMFALKLSGIQNLFSYFTIKQIFNISLWITWKGFLKRYIWPWGKWSSVSHDSYSCQRFPRTRPFPTQRHLEANNFVASIVEANDVLDKECPLACRPKLHKDWKYCWYIIYIFYTLEIINCHLIMNKTLKEYFNSNSVLIDI